MISNSEFFGQMREGEEYISCLMRKEVYNGLDFELRELMLAGDVRKKNTSLNQDEHHKKLIGKISKAKKDLVIYENGTKIDKQ